GTHDHLPRAIAADDVVMQGAAFTQRHPNHAAPCLLGSLADGLGHLARLACAVADPPLSVADDNESGEAETPAALDHLGDAVDVDEFFGELGLVALARLGVAVASSSALRVRARRRAWHTDPFQNTRPPSRAASAKALTRPW